MNLNFKIGSIYTRKSIGEVCFPGIGRPAGGNWDTGYVSVEDNLIIFMNIGVQGRTGHDFDNKFNKKTNEITWYGKPNTHSKQPTFKKLLEGKTTPHFFARWNQKPDFTYLGVGSVIDFKDSVQTNEGNAIELKLLIVDVKNAPHLTAKSNHNLNFAYKDIIDLINLYADGTPLTKLSAKYRVSIQALQRYIIWLNNEGYDVLTKADVLTKRVQVSQVGSTKRLEEITERLIELYNSGATYREIGGEFDVSIVTARNYINKLIDQGYDLKLRSQGRKEFSEEITERLIELYNSGATYREIGGEFDVSIATARNYINKLIDQGYDLKLRGMGTRTDIGKKADKRFYLRLIKLYEQGYSLTNIGEDLGVSSGTVRNYLKKLIDEGHNIKFRGQGKRSDRVNKNRLRRTNRREVESSNQKLVMLMGSQKR
jgi:transposase